MLRNVLLNPTPDQTFEIEGTGDFNFSKIRARAAAAQREGRVEEACNERFRAVQRLRELLPEEEEINLEWNHDNSRAALEIVCQSAVDHFLIGDFELAAALLEWLSELDPEDRQGSVVLLGFVYLALGEIESFEAIADDLPDKTADRQILLLWYAFRRAGKLPDEEVALLKNRFAPYYKEFTAAVHPADRDYLTDIESEHPTPAAQARELWLRTENLWALHPEFVEALRRTNP